MTMPHGILTKAAGESVVGSYSRTFKNLNSKKAITKCGLRTTMRLMFRKLSSGRGLATKIRCRL